MERGRIITKINRVEETIGYISRLPYSAKRNIWLDDLKDKKEFLLYLLYEWTVQYVDEED